MDKIVEEALLPGARNAVGTCLNVNASDRVFVISDEPRFDIGQALAQAAGERNATVHLVHMEGYGPRPLLNLPPTLADDLRAFEPNVTLLATSAQPGEIRFRLPLARLLRREMSVRHGHMIGVEPRLMQTGMMADYLRVAALTLDITARMKQAREVRVHSPAGTDLTLLLDNARRDWMPFHALYHHAGDWGNLPEGETCTSPVGVDGLFFADLVGDYFCDRYGVLDSPVRFEIAGGEVVAVQHDNVALAEEIWHYLHAHPNGLRVGEFGLGTNERLTELCGNLLQDEKFPGAHLAFGNPLPEITGADWSSPIHVDAVATRCTIEVDGETIMKEGRYLI